MAATHPDRRGISLMEVLISIGILAIGLSSVVAILPAARSQANRAVVLDRAAVLAANALADAATFGLLRPDSLTVAPTAATPVVVDPAFATSGLTNTVAGGLRNRGIFATGVTGVFANAPAAPESFHRLFTQSRDDVFVDGSASPDDPPLEKFADGVRSFEGRMSCLLCLQSAPAVGVPGRLSVVVFHGRDVSTQVVTGTITNYQATVSVADLRGRTFRDVVKPGVVLWEPAGRRFHQAVAAAIDSNGTSAFLTLAPGGAETFAGTVTVQFLPDSVGLAEQPFLPEATSPFTE
jgi:type II secretory pathway pseudopilin PulG